MKKVFFYNLIKWPVLWAIFFVFFHFSAKADFDGLVRLEGFSLAVYVSKGHEALGKQIAGLVDGANQYMSELVDKPATEVT